MSPRASITHVARASAGSQEHFPPPPPPPPAAPPAAAVPKPQHYCPARRTAAAVTSPSAAATATADSAPRAPPAAAPNMVEMMLPAAHPGAVPLPVPAADSGKWAPPRTARLHSSAHLLPVLDHAVALRLRRGEAGAGGGGLLLPAEPTAFHAVRAPSVSPSDYLKRLFRNAHCSRSAFVVATVYLDRAAARRPELALTRLNVHRLVLAATLLATKYLDDVLYDNAHFAFVGGLDVPELNMLELDLLHVLGFRLHVDAAQYAAAEAKLVAEVAAGDMSEYANLRFVLGNGGPPTSPKSIIQNPE